MNRLTLLALLLTLSTACSNLPDPQDPVIIEGLPSMQDVADSLNAADMQSLKWTVDKTTGALSYALPNKVDWNREFQAFLKDDLNRLRYQDAYDIVDEVERGIRHVTFTARSEKQEIRSVDYIFRQSRLSYFAIIKERDNLLSSSKQVFIFDGGQYTLSIEQRIPKLFDNSMHVRGSIIPAGDVWRLNFDLGDDLLPVNMITQGDRLFIRNGDELLLFERDQYDQSIYRSPYFNAYFKWTAQGDSLWTGTWVNAKYDAERIMDIEAIRGQTARFVVPESIALNRYDLNGDHRMIFNDEDGNPEDTVILRLKQDHHCVEGSILTKTGDYRYLEGVVLGDSLMLSTMDGTHGYLFKAAIKGERLEGVFKAGKTWRQSWTAELGELHEMPPAEELTTIKNNAFDFSLRDESGVLHSLTDARYQNKVVLISIMGTWCSNCLDETRFLKRVQARFPSDLEIVAVDFELVSDSTQAIENIKRYKQSLGIDFPVLLGGLKTNKQKVKETLPSLNDFISYPTLLVLDRSHQVSITHTGFSGPATGKASYQEFEEKYFGIIAELLQQ